MFEAIRTSLFWPRSEEEAFVLPPATQLHLSWLFSHFGPGKKVAFPNVTFHSSLEFQHFHIFGRLSNAISLALPILEKCTTVENHFYTLLFRSTLT